MADYENLMEDIMLNFPKNRVFVHPERLKYVVIRVDAILRHYPLSIPNYRLFKDTVHVLIDTCKLNSSPPQLKQLAHETVSYLVNRYGIEIDLFDRYMINAELPSQL
jgi:hypothetical protein